MPVKFKKSSDESAKFVIKFGETSPKSKILAGDEIRLSGVAKHESNLAKPEDTGDDFLGVRF